MYTENEKQELSEKIASTLRRLKVPCYMDGFLYLKMAIRTCIISNNSKNINPLIYSQIARQFYRTATDIESDINEAINSAWRSNEGTYLPEAFGFLNNSKPTDIDFIKTIANYCSK